jgi:hypothetical protein
MGQPVRERDEGWGREGRLGGHKRVREGEGVGWLGDKGKWTFPFYNFKDLGRIKMD